MKGFKIYKICVVILGIFLLGACGPGEVTEVGKRAPDFSLKDISGKTVNLSDYRGKVIILDFFATWCPPCKQEIPDFVQLQETYGPKGFSMVGVSLVALQDTTDFAERQRINYPTLIDNGKASSLYGPIRAIPATFVIDKNFVIVKKYIGYRPKDVFENDIKELLK